MERIIMLTVFLMQIYLTMSTSYKIPSLKYSYSLGNNLVYNSNISSPAIKPYYYTTYLSSINGWTTRGIYVQYIDVCLMIGQGYCPAFKGVTCGWQFLDVDSLYSNQIYYQKFDFGDVQEYQIKFDWISEVSYLLQSTGIAVFWNGVLIDSFYDNNCTLYTSTYYVKGKVGSNQVAFQGIGYADRYGIMIRNIRVEKLIYSYPSTNNNSTNNSSNTTQQDSTNYVNATANSTFADNSQNGTNNSTATNTTEDNAINNSTTNSSSNSTNNSQNQSFNTNNSYSFDDIYQYYNNSGIGNIYKLYKFITKYQIVTNCLSIFNSQQNLRFIFGFFMQFNHILPYNFHIRNMTIMSNFIIKFIQALDDQKAFIIDQYLYPMLGTSPDLILANFQYRADLPTNINNIGSDVVHRPNGILLQISDLFLIDAPVTVLCFILGYLFFRVLFNFRISILFRQYSIYGLFIFILINGKIEILTFHFVSEILQFNHLRPMQKFLMVAIVLFYFFVFFISVSLMFLYQSAYKKLLKLIFENCRRPKNSLVFVTVSFGFYNLALGFTHRLLLLHPEWQIVAILAIEVAYLIALIALLLQRFFQSVTIGLCLCLMNFIRVVFIVTLLVYPLQTELQAELSYVQEYSFYSLGVTWALSALLSIVEKLTVVLKIVKAALAKAIHKKNRIHNIPIFKLSHKKNPTIQDLLSGQKNKKKMQMGESINANSKTQTFLTIKSFKHKNTQKTQIKIIDKTPQIQKIKTNLKIKQTILKIVKKQTGKF